MNLGWGGQEFEVGGQSIIMEVGGFSIDPLRLFFGSRWEGQ